MEKLKLIYKKNTALVYSALFLMGAVLIFIQVALPVFSSVKDIKDQITSEQKRIDNYKNSKTVLGNQDSATLSRQEDLAVRALPPSKDIQAIYLALTQSAGAANISVRGFSVKVGDVFQKGSLKKSSSIGVPFVTVNLLVSQADIVSLYAFSQALSKELPLNAIVRADITSGEGDLDIAFYYKPFDLSAINKNSIVPLSAQDLNMLNTLSGFTKQ